jgi:hypothetical protein
VNRNQILKAIPEHREQLAAQLRWKLGNGGGIQVSGDLVSGAFWGEGIQQESTSSTSLLLLSCPRPRVTLAADE